MLIEAGKNFETEQEVQCNGDDYVDQSVDQPVEATNVVEASESAPDNDFVDLFKYNFNCK